MLPLILISRSEATIKKFLTDFIETNNYVEHLIYRIYPVNKELTIDQVRQIRKQVIYDLNFKRLFILFSFEKSSLEVQNALLKTLEERTQNNQFILISDNEEVILPTVRSRSKIFYLDKNENRVKIKKEVIGLIEKVIGNEKGGFLTDKVIDGISQEGAIDLLDQIVYYFRVKFNDDDSIKNALIIKKAFELKKLITYNNLNPQLTIDNFLFEVRRIHS